MGHNSRLGRLLPTLTTVLTLVAGCVTVDGSTRTANVTTPKEDARAGIEQWKCGDYFDGCGLFSTDCVTLTANLHNGTGKVKFDDFVESAWFQVQGIERRWNWCLNARGSYECAFVISVNGKGRYYNFRGSNDGKAKPSELFKCAKR